MTSVFFLPNVFCPIFCNTIHGRNQTIDSTSQTCISLSCSNAIKLRNTLPYFLPFHIAYFPLDAPFPSLMPQSRKLLSQTSMLEVIGCSPTRMCWSSHTNPEPDILMLMDWSLEPNGKPSTVTKSCHGKEVLGTFTQVLACWSHRLYA